MRFRTAGILKVALDAPLLPTELINRGYVWNEEKQEWQKTSGNRLITVVYSPKVPIFHTIKGDDTGKRERLFWVMFVKEQPGFTFNPEPRNDHVEIIQGECKGLFEIGSYSFGYGSQ